VQGRICPGDSVRGYYVLDSGQKRIFLSTTLHADTLVFISGCCSLLSQVASPQASADPGGGAQGHGPLNPPSPPRERFGVLLVLIIRKGDQT